LKFDAEMGQGMDAQLILAVEFFIAFSTLDVSLFQMEPEVEKTMKITRKKLITFNVPFYVMFQSCF
jgi:hypothetical protein